MGLPDALDHGRPSKTQLLCGGQEFESYLNLFFV